MGRGLPLARTAEIAALGSHSARPHIFIAVGRALLPAVALLLGCSVVVILVSPLVALPDTLVTARSRSLLLRAAAQLRSAAAGFSRSLSVPAQPVALRVKSATRSGVDGQVWPAGLVLLC
jgi:hypothetical protein